ncbi:MAG TPA: M56 family metallopeptidase, partial [Longimicrobiaceae bacterium]|nr:M56 family metallopeptidase [Longimicrobiaceae bacterium]
MISALFPAAGAASLVLKATLLLAATALAAGLLARRGAPAAVRHLVWSLAIAALLALPLLAAVLPGWRVPVAALPAPAAMPALPVLDDAVPLPPAAVAEEAPPVAGVSAGAAVPVRPPALAWREILVLAYLLGVAFLAGRLALGWWRVRRLARTAERVEDGRWVALVRELQDRLGVPGEVRLLRGGFASMPMTWGTFRPVVLLPSDADEWPEEMRRVVLLHELAHVARRDCLTQTLAGVACALYWFHPGAWYAARRLRVERELACDDRVLAAGTRAPTYARHLLDIAAAFRLVPAGAAHAVSMARPSQLEGRLLAVLDG